MRCKAIFEQHGDGIGRICSVLAGEGIAPAQCEIESVSSHSPRCVDNAEGLARLIFSPLHIDTETGKIKSFAFKDVEDKGLSVDRLDHSTPEDIHTRGREKAARDNLARPPAEGQEPRSYLGYVTAAVKDCRSICDDGTNARLFYVFDTALEANMAHSDVCFNHLINGAEISQNQLAKMRRKLQKVFSEKLLSP